MTGAIVAAIRAYSWLAGQTGLENIEIIPTPKYSYPSTLKIPFKYFFMKNNDNLLILIGLLNTWYIFCYLLLFIVITLVFQMLNYIVYYCFINKEKRFEDLHILK